MRDEECTEIKLLRLHLSVLYTIDFSIQVRNKIIFRVCL